MHNLIFSGHHGGLRRGINDQEIPFEVNLDVYYDDQTRSFDTLEGTVNYVRLFEIVQQRMHKPSFLLEKIGARIIAEIKKEYPFISEVSITIYKLQAPIGNFQGRAGVTLQRKFEE